MATPSDMKKSRALVIRLSSLGDVVLTTSTLRVLGQQFGEVHYLTSLEYAPLIEGHPSVYKVWTFDKSLGLKGWLELGKQLRKLKWDTVFDLHLSLRTRMARIFWRLDCESWVRIQKPYLKRLGLFVLKRLWPESLSPNSYRELFALTVGGTGDEGTDLAHLRSHIEEKPPSPQIGFMPASRWKGKEPPFEIMRDWIKEEALGRTIVVLGTDKDTRSKEWFEYLQQNNIRARSVIGANFQDLVRTILDCERVAGADTGLIHVAEALGVPVHVWYGPTSPRLGFAPSLEESTYSESSVVCSPCSKDGRKCNRFGSYVCWEKRA